MNSNRSLPMIEKNPDLESVLYAKSSQIGIAGGTVSAGPLKQLMGINERKKSKVTPMELMTR